MKKKQIKILILITVLAVAGAIFVAFFKNRKSPEYPEIKFQQDTISASVNASNEELLRGVTAFDPEDGDVTDSLIVEGTSNLIKGNSIRVTYVAFDSQNHVTKAERTVEFTDYTAPRFVMSAPLIFKQQNDISVLACVGAEDVFEGDISRNVKYSIITNGISLDEIGEYDIELSVTNKIGDTVKLPVTVEIADEDVNPAQITLSDYIVYLKQGDEFNPKDYVVSYMVNGAESTNVNGLSISSDVDTDEAGIYTVDYTYNSREKSRTRLIVVVE